MSYFALLDVEMSNDDKPPELAPKKKMSMINRSQSNDFSPALPPKKSSVGMFGSTGSLTDTASSSSTGQIMH